MSAGLLLDEIFRVCTSPASYESERTFDFTGIARATERARQRESKKCPRPSPDSSRALSREHEFELRAGGRTISEEVTSAVSDSHLSSLFNQPVVARFNRTDVYRGTNLVRQKYEMIEAEAAPAPAQEMRSSATLYALGEVRQLIASLGVMSDCLKISGVFSILEQRHDRWSRPPEYPLNCVTRRQTALPWTEAHPRAPVVLTLTVPAAQLLR